MAVGVVCDVRAPAVGRGPVPTPRQAIVVGCAVKPFLSAAEIVTKSNEVVLLLVPALLPPLLLLDSQ